MQELANRLERFLVMVDSDYHVELLTANQPTGKKWTVLLKVDVGAKRGEWPPVARAQYLISHFFSIRNYIPASVCCIQ